MVSRQVAIAVALTLAGCGAIADDPPEGAIDAGDSDGNSVSGDNCPNRVCDLGEDCGTCASDCGVCQPGCNDGTCDPNEDCTTCPSDCGVCPAICDDNTCTAGQETCTNCPFDCGPCVPLPPDHESTVAAFRVDYPTPMSPAQLAELLNRVAFQHRNEGWGLLRKTAGNRCPSPQGVDVACDILVNQPSIWHFDVLIDSGGAASPSWQDNGPCVLGPSSGCDIANFVAPIAP